MYYAINANKSTVIIHIVVYFVASPVRMYSGGGGGGGGSHDQNSW